MRMKEEKESWLKTQHSENEDHGIWSHHFMANRWGNNGNGETLYYLGFQITADGDCSHETKRHLLLGRKTVTNLDSILKSKDITCQQRSIYDYWKNHSFDWMDLCQQIMSLLFNMLSRLVTVFLPRSKCLLISWLHSPSSVILGPKKIKSVTVSIASPYICHELIWPNALILDFWMF